MVEETDPFTKRRTEAKAGQNTHEEGMINTIESLFLVKSDKNVRFI